MRDLFWTASTDVYKVFTNAQRLHVVLRLSLEINGDWKGKPREFGGLLLSNELSWSGRTAPARSRLGNWAAHVSKRFQGSAGRLATQPAMPLV